MDPRAHFSVSPLFICWYLLTVLPLQSSQTTLLVFGVRGVPQSRCLMIYLAAPLTHMF